MDLIRFETERIFTMNTIFGPVRAEKDCGKIWFVYIDCCAALSLSKSGTHKNRLNPEGVKKSFIPTAGGPQEMTMIDRGNFYRLVCRSNKERAKEFEYQVFDVILVEVGDTGSFIGPKTPLSIQPPEYTRKELLQIALENEIEAELLRAQVQEKDQQLQIAAPKAEAHDDLFESGAMISIGTLADMLKSRHGIVIGEKKLFEILRAKKCLQYDTMWFGDHPVTVIRPYYEYGMTGKKWFDVKHSKRQVEIHGIPGFMPRCFVTGKGELGIRDMLISQGYKQMSLQLINPAA